MFQHLSKNLFFVRELIDKVEHLTRESVHQAGAVFLYEEKSDDILLYADENQLSQVFVNLVKNALQAGATKIKVTAEIDFAETIKIAVSNNGRRSVRRVRKKFSFRSIQPSRKAPVSV